MTSGRLPGQDSGKTVKAPLSVMRPIASRTGSPSAPIPEGTVSNAVNQRLPSGPATSRLGAGTPGASGNKVTWPIDAVGDGDVTGEGEWVETALAVDQSGAAQALSTTHSTASHAMRAAYRWPQRPI